MTEQNGKSNPQEPKESESFLLEEEKNGIQIQKLVFTHDVEAADGEYDPFKDRNMENATSNMDTLTHLLKASLGTGILTMPKAFSCVGLVSGIFFTILVAVVCTHCSYVLIKCAHVLYKRTKKNAMTFPEVAQASFLYGPKWIRKWAYTFRIFIIVSLFMTYFGTCSVYTVLVAKNIMPVVAYYMNQDEEQMEIRLFIVALLIPLILMVWIRNLRYLAPVSMIANIFMAAGLGITCYYLVGTAKITIEDKNLWTPPSQWPQFFSLTIFAMEAIGVVMPLENSMKTPRSLIGCCGVLNKGMSGVTLVYICLGFLGYLRYGEGVQDSITLSLQISEIPAQIVRIAIAIAVYCTFGLQFFVCVEIAWNCVKDKCTKKPDLVEYIVRTLLVTACVLLAVAVPTIGPFMGVIGAFCFSILGLIVPGFIEIITYWDIGFGVGKYLIWKNILVVIFGLFALIFGTKDAIIDIIKIYTD